MSIPNYTLGTGLRPYILPHLRAITQGAALPQTKIEHLGFLNFLKAQDRPAVLKLNNPTGGLDAVQVKYLQRYTEEFSGTNQADVCNVTNFDPYHETSVNLTSFRFMALHLDDELVAQYPQDAVAMSQAGTPPTQLMNEMLERIMIAANAILSGVRTDLLTTLTGTGIGFNRSTGNAAAKTINFPLNSTQNALNADINEIISDFYVNLMSGTPHILCGTGSLFSKFLMQQYAKSANQAGVNTAIEAAGVKGYIDSRINTLLGVDQFLAIERNTVQLVEYMVFTGYKAGVKPGASVFGTIPLPIQMGTELVPIEFDYQLRYNDCAGTLTDQYYGSTITIQKGYTLILSKRCGLFQIPSDAWRGTDPNINTNGVLRYAATNV